MKKKDNEMDTILHSAHSRKNGIVFDSVECPFLQVDSSVDENGEIEVGVIPKSIGLIRDIAEAEKNFVAYPKTILIIIIALSLIVFILLLATKQNFGTIYGWIYFCFICLPRYLNYANSYYYFDRESKKIISNPIMRFHSAEHMAFNYYNNHKKVPTMEELKKSSRFSENCGSYNGLCQLLLYTILSIFLIVGSYLNVFLYLIIAVIILIAYIALFKSGYLKFLEVAVTKKPTELELQCAIKGLEAFEELEKSIRKQKEENTKYAITEILLSISNG